MYTRALSLSSWICLLVFSCLPASLSAQQQPAIRTLIRPPPIRLTLCIEPRGSFWLTGSGLPASQGDRRVLARAGDATIELPVESWTASRILVRLPADARLTAGGSYPVGIRDAGGTWLADADRPLVLCGPSAPVLAGAPGIQITPGRAGQPAVAPSKGAIPGIAPPAAPPREPTGEGVPTPAEEPAGRPAPEPPEEPAGVPLAEGPPPEAPCPHRLPSPPAYAVTCPLIMIGAGTEIPAPTAFVPVRIRTAALIVNSIGASAAARPPFTPIHFRTEPLIMTGVGSP